MIFSSSGHRKMCESRRGRMLECFMDAEKGSAGWPLPFRYKYFGSLGSNVAPGNCTPSLCGVFFSQMNSA